jgi:spore coat polysaccharide biosynthesis protein SpsF
MAARVVAIVQARMGSTRLPGKVLLDIAGHPMLWHVVTRLRRAASVDEVIVATSTATTDDVIVAACDTWQVATFRGSENDVLDRYYQAATLAHADIVVRITADCPLIDPSVVDGVVFRFLQQMPNVDYATNILPRRTFPRGLDTEVMAFAALSRVWRECHDLAHREHVTLFMYQHPELFRTLGATLGTDYSDLRWTVDSAEDLALVRRIYEHRPHDLFVWQDVLKILDVHPEWLEMNQHIQQKAV